MKIIEIIENNNRWKTILHTRFFEQEMIPNIKNNERKIKSTSREGYPPISKISTSSKTRANQMIDKEEERTTA